MIAAPSVRAVLRIVLIVVLVVVTLYLVYLLRRPISWVVVAGFIAVALSGPVNFLERYIKRGLAIAAVYLALLAIPLGVLWLLIPSLVESITNLVNNLPQYATDIQTFVNDNERLRDLNEQYDVTTKLREEAEKLPERIGDAAKILGDIGVFAVNSGFAAINILILSVFMVARGRRWKDFLVRQQPPERRERVARTVEHISDAIASYVGGALAQATVAGVSAYLVLLILGVPFAGGLALLVAFADLIPLVGATIGAVIVGVITVFADFPTATIIWTIYAIVYQQVENNVIQPRIQARAVNLDALFVLTAVLFGGTLLGVLGALLAIPAAATIQITVKEWLAYRRELRAAELATRTAPVIPGEGAPI